MITEATNTSFSNTGLAASALPPFSYYVVAREGAGNQSEPSNMASATTAAVVEFASPTNGPVIGTDSGLTATYFNKRDFSCRSRKRTDATINFD
jgi:hypothetical protein